MYGGSDQLIITRSENESEFTFSFNDGYVLNAVVKNSGVEFSDFLNSSSEIVIPFDSAYLTINSCTASILKWRLGLCLAVHYMISV